MAVCLLTSQTSFTCERKLNSIAASTTESIHYSIAFTSLCYMFSYSLRRNAEPTLCG